MSALFDRPLAWAGLTSYRYPSRYGGWIMIGARSNADALREAERSMERGESATGSLLQIWDGERYVGAEAR